MLRTFLFVTALALLFSPQAVRPQESIYRDEVVAERVARGIDHLRINRVSRVDPNQRWAINVLEVDPTSAKLSIGLALDEIVGTETTSSIALRNGAVAAINGGYFRTTGTIRGEPMGLLEKHGKLLSEPVIDRAALSSMFDGRSLRVALTHTSAALQVSTSKAMRNIDGINRPRETNEVVLYTGEFHRNTLSGPGGCEVRVSRNRVLSIDRNGSTSIPAGGYVLSGDGKGAEWLEGNLRRSQRVDVRVRVIHQPPLQFTPEFSIGGGPMLVANGAVVGEAEFRGFSESLTRTRHPRTSAGVRTDGKLILVTVDGRQPALSAGMTIAELSNLMIELGCVDAINFDGGGSTTMVIRNKVINHPSDTTGERAVSDALLIFSRP